ncbi:MAG: HEPN domain-containing protein [Ignavibacteria bacterium]|nr:HEPN domain-containing protein [Ignavibacteria bacterium]
MNNTTSDLSKYRMIKAKEDLSAAELLLNNNHFAQSLNRSYYTNFHAVRSLLAYDKFDSKTHSGIISYFNKNYVKDGGIDKKYSEILVNSQRIRTKSDYDDLYVADKETAEKQLIDAKEFISFIESFIKQNKD